MRFGLLFGGGLMALRDTIGCNVRRVIGAALSNKEISNRDKHRALIALARKRTHPRDRMIILNYAATIRKAMTNG